MAIQAKFNKGKIGKSEINSFVAELGSTYYTRGLIVSTVDEWNSNARATIDKNEKGIEIIGLSDLRNSQISGLISVLRDQNKRRLNNLNHYVHINLML